MRCILLFVKNPVAGQVKTRLGSEIGMEEAAVAYRRLTEQVLRQLPRDVPLRVCFAPAEAEATVRAWLARPDATFQPQVGVDLGARLAHAFQTAFTAGCTRAAVIGSDCIDLSPGLFAEAFTALDSHDAVLGPSLDGGYYLLALRRPDPQVFAGIDWSTERVCAQTQARLHELGWSCHLLPSKTDVDTLAEWREAVAKLA